MEIYKGILIVLNSFLSIITLIGTTKENYKGTIVLISILVATLVYLIIK